MLLSPAPSYSILNIGTFFIFVALILLSLAIAYREKIKELMDDKPGSLREGFYGIGTFFFIFLMLYGVTINISSPRHAFYKNTRTEIVEQLQTIYNVSLTPKSVNMLTKISVGTVGSDNIGTTVSAPFMDDNNLNQVFKYQVSNNGSARLLEADLVFEEKPVSENIILEEIIEEDAIVEDVIEEGAVLEEQQSGGASLE